MTRSALRIPKFDATNWLIGVMLVLFLAGYVLPWVAFEEAAFTLNGFDLAEWISLHPAAHTESPALLSAGMIRISLLWAASAAALLAFPISLRMIVILLIAAAALPPPEHILSLSDPNYAQQTAIAIACLTVPMLLLFLRRWQSGILLAIGICAIASTSFGAWRTVILLSGFEIGVILSIGVVVALAAGVLSCIVGLTRVRFT